MRAPLFALPGLFILENPMTSKFAFDTLAPEYADLWTSIQIRPDRRSSVKWAADRVLSGRDRYAEIEDLTGVPWFVVGMIHVLEGGGRFNTHLHNGDSLAKRTVNVPQNRPASHHGPFKWAESAVDALEYDGVTSVRQWSPVRVAHVMEKYNGFGYRRSDIRIPSPYLWSFTTHYRVGKFTTDHGYDASAVSKQAGAMAVLKYLTEVEPSVLAAFRPDATASLETLTPFSSDVEEEIDPDSYPKAPEGAPVRDALQSSGTLKGLIYAGAGTVIGWFNETVGFFVEAAAKTSEWSGSVHVTLTNLGFSTAGVATALTVGGITYAGSRRIRAAAKGKIG